MPHTLRQTLVWSVVLFGLAAGGCLTARNEKVVAGYPISEPADHCHASATFVYVVNGLDPVHLAGVPALTKRLQASGYPNTQFAEWKEIGRIEKEIRKTHGCQPDAQFALIGYSIGAPVVRNAATRLIRDGVPVALVAYIGGDYLSDSAETRVPGAGRVVNITGDGHLMTGRNLFFNGTDITGATNVRLAGTRHFFLPEHPETFATLFAALNAATGGF
jgi:hypothetical protein